MCGLVGLKGFGRRLAILPNVTGSLYPIREKYKADESIQSMASSDKRSQRAIDLTLQKLGVRSDES